MTPCSCKDSRLQSRSLQSLHTPVFSHLPLSLLDCFAAPALCSAYSRACLPATQNCLFCHLLIYCLWVARYGTAYVGLLRKEKETSLAGAHIPGYICVHMFTPTILLPSSASTDFGDIDCCRSTVRCCAGIISFHSLAASSIIIEHCRHCQYT